MFYLLYIGVVLGLAVSHGGKAGLLAGVTVIVAGFLAFLSGSGLRGSLTRTTPGQKIAGLGLAAICFGGAIFLFREHTLHLFGLAAPAWQWLLGGAIGSFVFAGPFVPPDQRVNRG